MIVVLVTIEILWIVPFDTYFRLIKEFDREIKDEEARNPPEVNKQLNDEKQSMVGSFKTPLSSEVVYFMSMIMEQPAILSWFEVHFSLLDFQDFLSPCHLCLSYFKI